MNPVISILTATTLSCAALAASAAPAWETLPAPASLPPLAKDGYVAHAGARIWYGIVGAGSPVILLHGGRASSLGWGNQVAALVASHHQVILIDSRAQGRSTPGEGPLSYALMESDLVAVMDALKLPKADVVGWSDGANIGVTMAMKHPARLGKLFAFGPNVNSRYLTPPAASPLFAQVGERLVADYASLGGTPDGFERMSTLVRAMQAKEPDYSDAQLAAIKGPVIAIAGADHDEFISRRHVEYAAAAIPGARLVMLHGVSHFAPWQDADGFNAAMLGFLDGKD